MAPRMIAARKANEITVTIVKVVVARIAAPYTISSIEIGNNDPFGRSCQLNSVRYGVMPRKALLALVLAALQAKRNSWQSDALSGSQSLRSAEARFNLPCALELSS